MKYVLITDNDSYSNASVAAHTDNSTLWDASTVLLQYPGTGIVDATFAADNTTSVSYTFSSSSSESQTLFILGSRSTKNFSTDNATASIFVDATSPTIDNVTITGSVSDNLTAVDNTSYTSSATVTIKLDYADDDNGTNVTSKQFWRSR